MSSGHGSPHPEVCLTKTAIHPEMGRSDAAVLVFADSRPTDAARRHGIPRHAVPLPHRHAIGIADVHLFTDRRWSQVPAGLKAVHTQRGRTFSERLENAVAHLFRLGYQRIVIVGRDCPQLTRADVTDAIRLLDGHDLVIGPDHRGGCWLIGLHAANSAILKGVRWRANTDADELRSRAPRCAVLATKYDIDTPADLALVARRFDLGLLLVLSVLRAPSMPRRPGDRARTRVRRLCQMPPPSD